MKLIFTSPIIEYPAAGGPALRIENAIKALSSFAEVHIFYRGNKSELGGQSAQDFLSQYSKSFHCCPSSKILLKNRYLKKTLQILNDLTGLLHLADAIVIRKYAKKNNIKLVWLGYGNISFPLILALKRVAPGLKLVCDTDSVWSRFVLRELPFIKNPLRKLLVQLRGRRKEKEEKSWVNLCDLTTAVSAVDAEYYRSLTTNHKKVSIFSNVIDLRNYEKSDFDIKLPQRPSVLLAGSYGHHNSPMDIAARWVINDILPLVHKKIPNLDLFLVGKGSDLTLNQYKSEHIHVLGKVKSMLPYLYHVNASLVPLKFESGTRFKILEGGACGTPIISTTLGAEGIPVIHDQHILIADDAEAFAQAIVKIVEDPDTGLRISQACKKLVQDQYSLQKLISEGQDIIKKLDLNRS